MPETNTGKKLKEYRLKHRLTLPEMAKQMNVSTTTIVNYESGKRLPDIDFLIDFSQFSDECLLQWLRLRIMDSDSVGAIEAKTELDQACNNSLVSSESQTFVSLPLFDIKEVFNNTPKVWRVADESPQFSTAWIERELHASPSDLKMVLVDDDSMMPTLRPGDMMLLDQRANIPNREGIYILRMNGVAMVKRLQSLPGELIKLSSDNPAYDTFSIPLSNLNDQEVAILGRVIWVVWAGRRV